MKKTRLLSIAAVAAAGALVLAGCSTSGDNNGGNNGGEKPAGESGGSVTVAITNDLTAFNEDTPEANLDTNGIYRYLTSTDATYPDPTFKLNKNTDVVSYEKTSDSPLTVKYTIKAGSKWSDGEPITADDMLVSWAKASGYYDDATTDAEGKVTKGNQYFQQAGSPEGFNSTAFPELGDDNMSMTLKYSKPFVDWELFDPITLPAHVLAKKGGLAKAEDLTKVFKDAKKGDVNAPAAANPTLVKVSQFANSGYNVTSMPSDKDLTVASGPWMVKNWTPKQSIEFVRNPEYKGAMTPKLDKLILRIIPDSAAQVSALENGEVQLAYPQASGDTKKSLEAIGNSIDILTGDQVAYDHMDINQASPAFKDLNVRKAFMLTIPRQQIVDSLIKPVNPDAKVLDSQIYLPNQAEYADTIKMNGSSAYAKPDIEQAKKLLNGATPTVAILYNNKNPNRVDTFQAIQVSAAKAGFKVVDKGDPQWSSKLAGGDYDASIYGWTAPGVGHAMLPQLFSKNGGGNYNRWNYTDKIALETQTTVDEAEITKLSQEIDKSAFENGYGLPLFQSAGVYGVSKKVQGVKYMGNQTGPVWNAWEWTVKKSDSSK